MQSRNIASFCPRQRRREAGRGQVQLDPPYPDGLVKGIRGQFPSEHASSLPCWACVDDGEEKRRCCLLSHFLATNFHLGQLVIGDGGVFLVAGLLALRDGASRRASNKLRLVMRDSSSHLFVRGVDAVCNKAQQGAALLRSGTTLGSARASTGRKVRQQHYRPFDFLTNWPMPCNLWPAPHPQKEPPAQVCCRSGGHLDSSDGDKLL